MAWLEGVERSRSASGPLDAWLTPRRLLSFSPCSVPVDAPVAKLGGQPVWLDEPFWPVSRDRGTPMTFVGQFPVPGPRSRMSYLFMTDDDSVALTSEPEAGENALLVQPEGRIPPFIEGFVASTGPSLWRRGRSWTERVAVELDIRVHLADDAAELAYQRDVARQAAERRGTFLDGDALSADDLGAGDCRSYVGGQPLFWQPTTTTIEPTWRFFFQLDGAEGSGDDSYALNFGGGTGYAFLSQDEREGRFFWDCV